MMPASLLPQAYCQPSKCMRDPRCACVATPALRKKTGTALRGVVRVAAVDADVDKELKGRFGIQVR